MREERIVWADHCPCTVVLSDEREALLAAAAAGRAVVGIWGNGREGTGAAGRERTAGEKTPEEEMRVTGGDGAASLPAKYLVETLEAADDRYLERVARRHLGLPWTIAETDRLLIREFTVNDAAGVPAEKEDTDADRIFYTPDRLAEYIRFQYGFYEYGVWAVTDRYTGELIGKAGIWNAAGDCGAADGLDLSRFLELGYHIFKPFRRRGYAAEACRGIISMLRSAADEDGEDGFAGLLAKTDASNEASVRVLESCGFRLAGEKRVKAGRCVQWYVLYL